MPLTALADEAAAQAAVDKAWSEMDQAFARYDADGAMKYFTPEFTMKMGTQKLDRAQLKDLLGKQLEQLKAQGVEVVSKTSIFTFALENPNLARAYIITETTTKAGDAPAELSKEMRLEYWENGPDGWRCKSGELVQRD